MFNAFFIAVALALGTMIVVMAMMVGPGLRSLLMALVPYGEIDQLGLPG